MNAFLRERFWQVWRTTQTVFQAEGFGALLWRAVRWLMGERGYYRRIAFPPEPYEDYLRRTAIQPPVLDWQSVPCIAIVTHWHADIAMQNTIDSILRQNSPQWIWVILGYIGDMPPNFVALNDNRIQWVTADGDFTHALFKIVQSHIAPYITCLDAGDQLAPHAIATAQAYLLADPTIDYLYSDIDRLTEAGTLTEPRFHPVTASPIHLLSADFMGRFGVFRATLYDQPMAEWLFHWYVIRQNHRIQHIPQILYHQRHGYSAPLADEPVNILRVLAAENIHAQIAAPFIRWQPQSVKQISVIIPSKDKPELLAQCLDGVYQQSGSPCEVIVVDTGSRQPQTRQLYTTYQRKGLRVLDDPRPFNFSAACNLGAKAAQGDALLFLNNDVQMLHPEWLARMTQWLDFPDVGAVGCKLLYPNGEIQHAGVILGLQGLVDNFMVYLPEHTETPFGSDDCYREFLAVTGACLLVRRSVFEQVGGFDEGYQLNFSDVALCLAIHHADYRIVYTPDARLIHLESQTHRRRVPPADIQRARQQFQIQIQRGDPFYSPNLSLQSSQPRFRTAHEQ
jgi:GT2 family glycosyltransferase